MNKITIRLFAPAKALCGACRSEEDSESGSVTYGWSAHSEGPLSIARGEITTSEADRKKYKSKQEFSSFIKNSAKRSVLNKFPGAEIEFDAQPKENIVVIYYDRYHAGWRSEFNNQEFGAMIVRSGNPGLRDLVWKIVYDWASRICPWADLKIIEHEDKFYGISEEQIKLETRLDELIRGSAARMMKDEDAGEK